MASFATPADLLSRYDWTILADLITPADNSPPATRAELLVDPTIQALLNDAAGDIVLACVPAERYSDQDLAAIAAATDGQGNPTPSASTLKRLNCVLAVAKTYEYKLYSLEDTAKHVSGYQWALELLEMLRNGNRVFDLTPQVDAGVMGTTPLAGVVQEISAGDLQGNIYLMSGVSRIFGDLGTKPR